MKLRLIVSNFIYKNRLNFWFNIVVVVVVVVVIVNVDVDEFSFFFCFKSNFVLCLFIHPTFTYFSSEFETEGD